MKPIKRTTKQLIIAITLIAAILSTAFLVSLIVIRGQMKEIYQMQLDEANQLIESNIKYAYVAKDTIPASETITEDKLQYQEIFSDLPEDSYVAKEDLGKMAIVEIPALTPVLKNMITKSTVPGDVREEEFNVFYLSSNLKENDYIDVRIIYPNGEDYSVLSKKAVKDLSLENGKCFLWMNAEELLRISGAIVDTFLHEGSKLYTVKYIEPMAQEATEITYIPNKDVINIIQKDPNVVKLASESLSQEMRSSLDDRLSTFYQNYNGQVSWDNVKPNNISYDAISSEATVTPEAENNSSENTEDSEEGVYYVE